MILKREKGIKHSHIPYPQKRLTQEEQAKVDKMVKKNRSVTANSAIAGITNSKIFNAEEEVKSINPIILNKDRIKHEIRKSQIRNGLSNPLSKDPFEEFAKFPEYIIFAELALSKFCIMFSAPEMGKIKLPFSTLDFKRFIALYKTESATMASLVKWA